MIILEYIGYTLAAVLILIAIGKVLKAIHSDNDPTKQ